MKVAVVGNGNVGLATFQALITLPEINEIALVGRNEKKIEGEINDYKDYQALRPFYKCKLSGGGYQLTKDADIIVYTAGSPRKPDQSRLDLIKSNVEVAKEIFTQINQYNQDAIIIVVSNPVDIITTVIKEVTKRPANKVIGTGTLLDSARLRRIVAEFLDISVDSVTFNVIGEHGNSSCMLWSGVSIAGMKLDEFLKLSSVDHITLDKEKLHDMVTSAGGKIIKEKGYTAYGVAAAVCRVTKAIINNTREIQTVSTVLNGAYDVDGIAISVPCIVGKSGAEVMMVNIAEDEKKEFDQSVKILKEAYLNVMAEG